MIIDVLDKLYFTDDPAISLSRLVMSKLHFRADQHLQTLDKEPAVQLLRKHHYVQRQITGIADAVSRNLLDQKTLQDLQLPYLMIQLDIKNPNQCYTQLSKMFTFALERQPYKKQQASKTQTPHNQTLDKQQYASKYSTTKDKQSSQQSLIILRKKNTLQYNPLTSDYYLLRYMPPSSNEPYNDLTLQLQDFFQVQERNHFFKHNLEQLLYTPQIKRRFVADCQYDYKFIVTGKQLFQLFDYAICVFGHPSHDFRQPVKIHTCRRMARLIFNSTQNMLKAPMLAVRRHKPTQTPSTIQVVKFREQAAYNQAIKFTSGYSLFHYQSQQVDITLTFFTDIGSSQLQVITYFTDQQQFVQQDDLNKEELQYSLACLTPKKN